MSFDPNKKAVEYGLNLYYTLSDNNNCGLESKNGKLVAKGLRARARSFPNIISSTGLLPAVAFAMSKINNRKMIQAAWKILNGSSDPGHCNELAKDLQKDGGGYTIIVALIAKILEDSKLCKIKSESIDTSLAGCLVNKEFKDIIIAEKIVQATLQEFKKLVDALFIDK